MQGVKECSSTSRADTKLMKRLIKSDVELLLDPGILINHIKIQQPLGVVADKAITVLGWQRQEDHRESKTNMGHRAGTTPARDIRQDPVFKNLNSHLHSTECLSTSLTTFTFSQ